MPSALTVGQLDALLGQLGDAVVAVWPGGAIGYASPAVRHLIGFDARALTGVNVLDLIHPDDAHGAIAELSLDTPQHGEGIALRVRHADGAWRDLVATAKADLSETGVPVFVAWMLRPADPGRSTLDALRHRLAFEDLLTRVASSFIHRPAHEVSACIAEALADIGEFAHADRSYVYLLNAPRGLLELAHEWTAPDVDPARTRTGTLPASRWGCWLQTMADGDAVYLPQVANLDEDWTSERDRLLALGVRSALAVPILDGRRLVGFIGFDLVESERLWSDDHLAVLSSTANIVSQALGRSDAEQRFGLAFDWAPLGMALHGPDGRHIQVNPAFCSLLGFDEGELIGASVLDFIMDEDRELLVEEHRRILDGLSDTLTMELRFEHAAGHLVWCRVHSAAVRTDDGSLRYTVSHVEDITERVIRDSELRASEERYRTLIENSPAIVARFDRTLSIVYLSSAVDQVAGIGTANLVDHPDGLFAAREDPQHWREELTRVFETGQRWDSEWQLSSRGRTFWFQSRAVPEFDEQGDVEHVLVVNTDITALKRSEAQLAHQALHDPLTGLANRALLVEHLERSLARRHVDGATPALLFIDLDRFKLVNDSLGHRAGDELLIAVAERLTDAVRPADLVARLGGDEFVIVLEGVDDPTEPVRVAGRVKAALSIPLVVAGHDVVPTGSIGIAVPTGDHTDADGLMRDADAAMYLAKANGRNRFEIFDAQLRTQATEKLQMETALRRALDVGGLEVHYQPELDLTTGAVVGFEALVRWNHPTEGMLAAWAFIELAEETGLILPLGEWVLREACRQAGAWTAERRSPPLTLRVNLSGKQFAQADLVEQVVGALADGGLAPSALCLEITETALMADPAAGLRVLNDLRALGVELAIDDFGTGYSSLAYLKRFPVDVLKIDRSFVDGLGDDPDDTAIATAIISLARSMGMRVVAEGVETRRQLDELRRLGCDHAQGFLFAKPSPPAEAWAVPSPFPVARDR